MIGLIVRCKDEPYVDEFVNYYLHQGVDKIYIVDDDSNQEIYTPLKIYNETPEWRLNRDLRATLPINELKGKPPTEVCPILNLHRCKISQNI